MFHTFSLLSVHFEVIQLMPFIFHKFISPSSQPAFSSQHHPVNLCYTVLIGKKFILKTHFIFTGVHLNMISMRVYVCQYWWRPEVVFGFAGNAGTGRYELLSCGS